MWCPTLLAYTTLNDMPGRHPNLRLPDAYAPQARPARNGAGEAPARRSKSLSLTGQFSLVVTID